MKYYEGGGIVCAKFENPRKDFDNASLRWTPLKGDREKGEGSRALIGCPKGQWNPKTKRCRVGTKAHKVYIWSNKRRCPKGYRKR